MRHLTVLVDMDDTIENLCETWVLCLNEKYGTAVPYDSINSWDMTVHFPMLTRDQIFSILREEDFWRRVKPIDGASEYLQKLIADGHTVLIVTSSHQDTVAPKMNLVLYKYFSFFTYKNVIIANQKDYIDGDILVDDGVHNHTRKRIANILMTANHNRSYDAEAHGLIRADNWKDIYAIITKIAREKSNVQSN